MELKKYGDEIISASKWLLESGLLDESNFNDFGKLKLGHDNIGMTSTPGHNDNIEILVKYYQVFNAILLPVGYRILSNPSASELIITNDLQRVSSDEL